MAEKDALSGGRLSIVNPHARSALSAWTANHPEMMRDNPRYRSDAISGIRDEDGALWYRGAVVAGVEIRHKQDAQFVEKWNKSRGGRDVVRNGHRPYVLAIAGQVEPIVGSRAPDHDEIREYARRIWRVYQYRTSRSLRWFIEPKRDDDAAELVYVARWLMPDLPGAVVRGRKRWVEGADGNAQWDFDSDWQWRVAHPDTPDQVEYVDSRRFNDILCGADTIYPSVSNSPISAPVDEHQLGFEGLA